MGREPAEGRQLALDYVTEPPRSSIPVLGSACVTPSGRPEVTHSWRGLGQEVWNPLFGKSPARPPYPRRGASRPRRPVPPRRPPSQAEPGRGPWETGSYRPGARGIREHFSVAWRRPVRSGAVQCEDGDVRPSRQALGSGIREARAEPTPWRSWHFQEGWRDVASHALGALTYGPLSVILPVR